MVESVHPNTWSQIPPNMFPKYLLCGLSNGAKGVPDGTLLHCEKWEDCEDPPSLPMDPDLPCVTWDNWQISCHLSKRRMCLKQKHRYDQDLMLDLYSSNSVTGCRCTCYVCGQIACGLHNYTAAFKQWPCCMLHHKWEGVQMTQQREEREKTNHPKQLSCTVQPQGEGLEGAQGHLEQAQSWANEFPPLEMLSCIDTREEICFYFSFFLVRKLL